MDRKGAIPFNPNILNSNTGKVIALGLLTFGAVACGRTVDQGTGSGNSVLDEMRTEATMDSGRAAYLANATPVPNYPATEQARNNELLSTSPSCTIIDKGETASHIIEQMGFWPKPNDIQGGIVPSIAVYDSKGVRITDPIAITDVLNGGTPLENLGIGNEVCIGSPVDLLKKQPSAPESRLPARPQMSQRGFSPSKGSQPARPMTFRRA